MKVFLGEWGPVIGFAGTAYWLVWSHGMLTPEQRRAPRVKAKFYITLGVMAVAAVMGIAAFVASVF